MIRRLLAMIFIVVGAAFSAVDIFDGSGPRLAGGGTVLLCAGLAVGWWASAAKAAALRGENACLLIASRAGERRAPDVLVIEEDDARLTVVTEIAMRVRFLDTCRAPRDALRDAGNRHVCYGGAIAKEIARRTWKPSNG